MIETYTRNATFSTLKPYCIFAGDNDFIEIVEWKNGEGVDVFVSGQDTSEYFTLTHGQMAALIAMYNYKEEA